MLSRDVRVANRLGLHARAAAKFVHLASRFQSQVKVSKGSQTIDGKSIMGIMMLAAGKGTMLEVCAEGADAEQALDALCRLIEDRFGEEE